MAKYLYRMGHWSVRHSKKVLTGGLGFLLMIAILAVWVGPGFNDEISIPGLQSAEAIELLNQEFGGEQETGGQTRLVVEAPEQETLSSPDSQALIQQFIQQIEEDPQVKSVSNPYESYSVSADQTIAYMDVTYKIPAGEVGDDSREHVTAVAEAIRDAGWQAELTGSAYSQMKIMGPSEVVGVLIAFLVLSVLFGSFLLGMMPIVTAVAGLGIGLIGVMLGSKLMDIPSTSMALAAMLGLAVGIDYALFIVSRFRQQLSEGYERTESIAIANATAGSSVVFAGITVIIGLAGLSVAKIPFLTAMGMAGAFCVFIAMLSAVIFVPAVLGILGERITGKSRRKRTNKATNRSNRWGQLVTKRPWMMVLTGMILLTVIAIPFSRLELGSSDDARKSTELTERRAYDLITKGFGAGFHSPLIVLVEPDGEGDFLANVNAAIEEIRTLPNIGTVSPAIPGPSGKLALINIFPETGPNDSETPRLVEAIRNEAPEIVERNHVNLIVTGSTAVNIEISQNLNEALPKFCLVIIGLAFLLLMAVFRSLLVPIKAVLGFVLSLAATLGFVVYVIQEGHMGSLFGIYGTGPVLNFLPIIVVGILFGLAMDYEVFLVSRMREAYKHTGDAKRAVLEGMGHSGGVVTAAGLIMISVFTGFMLAEDPIIKSMGFALAFGILFDAFVVRMMIVPGAMTLLGKFAWYLPKWLDRILPNLDIEGDRVMEQLEREKASAANDAPAPGL